MTRGCSEPRGDRCHEDELNKHDCWGSFNAQSSDEQHDQYSDVLQIARLPSDLSIRHALRCGCGIGQPVDSG
jgi:hypothetical protein